MRARGIALLCAFAAAATAVVLLRTAPVEKATGGEPDAASPPTRAGVPRPSAPDRTRDRPKSIAHPFLLSLVGAWDVTPSTPAAPDVRATTEVRASLSGRALLVEEVVTSERSPEASHAGFGVLRASDDGTKARLWWWDSRAAAPAVLSGDLTESSFELTGDLDGTPATVRMARSGDDADALAFSLRVGDREPAKSAYRRARTPPPAVPEDPTRAITSPLLRAAVGEWATAGDVRGTTLRGTARARLVQRGASFVVERDVDTPAGVQSSVAVARVVDGGKGVELLSFTARHHEPIGLRGTLSDDAYDVKGPFLLGEVSVRFERTAGGFRLTSTVGTSDATSEEFTRVR